MTSGTNFEIFGLDDCFGSYFWAWKICDYDGCIAHGVVDDLPGTYDLDGKNCHAEAERVACCVGHCNGIDVTKMAILFNGEAVN
jgi:hypothetical protein